MESKQLKDVLHFYLGCEAIMSTDHWFTPEGDKRVKIHGLTKTIEDRVYVFYSYDTAHGNSEIEYFKPILKKLSSMTEEEKNEFAKRHKFLMPSYTRESDIINMSRCLNWLRKNSFDCDELIESGLAIDNQNIKQP